MSVHRKTLTLASGSVTRARLLQDAGLDIDVVPPGVDEDAIRLKRQDLSPRALAETLADAKAKAVSARVPGLVLGCDQVLALEERVFSKPRDAEEACRQLATLSGATHQLLSAAALYDDGAPSWRTVGIVTLHMRPLSPEYISDYVARNWASIRHSVGAYKLEEEGARFFTRIEGDYFTVLGLPMLDLLSHLATQGVIRT